MGTRSPPLVHRAFVSAQRATGLEELFVDVVGRLRAVVRGEDDNRVLLQPEFPQKLDNAPDIAVQVRDHRCIRSLRFFSDDVAPAFFLVSRRLFPAALILAERFLRNRYLNVRNRHWQIAEKRLVLALSNEAQRLLNYDVLGVLAALATFVSQSLFFIFHFSLEYILAAIWAVPSSGRIVCSTGIIAWRRYI